MAIEYPIPAGQQINEGDTARQWMMPAGTYINEPGTAAVVAFTPLLFVIT